MQSFVISHELVHVQREGGCLQPVCLFTRHKLRAGWGLPGGFILLVVGHFILSSEVVNAPGTGTE